MVDSRVRALVLKSQAELTPKTKKALLSLLHLEVNCNGSKGPFAVQIHQYVSSFVRSIQEGADLLEVPSWNYLDTDSCGF